MEVGSKILNWGGAPMTVICDNSHKKLRQISAVASGRICETICISSEWKISK